MQHRLRIALVAFASIAFTQAQENTTSNGCSSFTIESDSGPLYISPLKIITTEGFSQDAVPDFLLDEKTGDIFHNDTKCTFERMCFSMLHAYLSNIIIAFFNCNPEAAAEAASEVSSSLQINNVVLEFGAKDDFFLCSADALRAVNPESTVDVPKVIMVGEWGQTFNDTGDNWCETVSLRALCRRGDGQDDGGEGGSSSSSGSTATPTSSESISSSTASATPAANVAGSQNAVSLFTALFASSLAVIAYLA